jgi:segregation and condensation protein B
MNPESRQAIESILMVADQPVEPSVLAQLLEVPKAEIEAACQALAAEYEENGRGFILAQVAGGYRFQSHPDLAPYVERFVLDGQTSRLSSAALETLAIVAYKQPISRMQIAAIRGVNVDGVLRTLQQRGYIDEAGRDPGPGSAVLFGTTSLFLERVGLNSLEDLPPLADFVPGADVIEALEDGLRPEPISVLAVEAAAVAEVLGDDGDGPDEADEEPAEAAGEISDDPNEAAGEPPKVVGPVGEEQAELAEDTVDTDELIDLTETAGAGSASRAQDLSSPVTSTVRHPDPPPGGELPDLSFRSAPGARTGGEGQQAEVVGETIEDSDKGPHPTPETDNVQN